MPAINADTLGPYRKPWLLPVLLAQGKWVKMKALRLPEASGPRSGCVEGRGEPLSLLLLGDSAAAGVGVATQDQGLAPALARAIARRSGRAVAWRVVAVSGVAAVEAAERLLPLLDEADPGQARVDLVVTSLGVNDVMGLTASDAFRSAMHELIGSLRRRFGADVPFILGRVPPLAGSPLFSNPLRGLVAWRIHRINDLLAEVAAMHAAVLLADAPDRLDPSELAEDGFHPNASSYPAWAEHLAGLVPARIL
jgi:lysophospholipase L1-like esterase